MCSAYSKIIPGIILTLMLSAGAIFAQTSGFTYQGRLAESSVPANGSYDLRFALFDSASGNVQVGQTQTRASVAVAEGVFTVTLDFGANAFPGASRFLEVSARPVGATSFTVLTPRQPITSTPYAMRSLSTAQADIATNTQQLGGVAASAFVKTDDARLSDQRDPKTGSSNYIQNTTSQQAGSNFNISGNGTTGGTLSGSVVNATTRFDIGGQRLLVAQTSSQNTILGLGAGASNTTGERNSLFGHNAGKLGTTASFNAYFGNLVGQANTTGSGNAFFGFEAGKANTTGSHNVFVGDQAGFSNTTGNGNVIIGDAAGFSNTAESDNTFIGDGADGAPGITNATAIGANATVTQSNTLVLGNNVNVGIGTTNPATKLEVAGNVKLSGANSGLIFPDGTSLTTAPSGTMSGTNIISAINDPTTAGTINDTRLSGNVAKLFSNVFNGNQRVNGNVTINDQANSGLRVQTSINGGTVASFGGLGEFQIDAPGTTGGRFAVRENGNVGIGTANPTAKLQVAGTVESTAGGFKFPDGSVQPSAANPAIGKVFTNDPNVAPEVEIHHDGFITFVNHLTLPPGIYIVTATIQFENRANGFLQDNTRLVKCKLINEFLWHNRLGAPNTGMDQVTATMHTVLTQTTTGQISIGCGNLESSGKVFAKARRMTAVRVADNPQ